MKRKDFEQLVSDAIAALPARAKAAMDNVAFVIEKETRRKKTNELGIRRNEALLGLYEGIPRTKRGSGYFGVLPDKITLFQKPIEELGEGNRTKLKQAIHEVIWHEIGHHLGFDEKEVRALETKKRNIETHGQARGTSPSLTWLRTFPQFLRNCVSSLAKIAGSI